MHLHTEQVSPASRPDTHFYHFSIPAFDENTAPAVELGGDIGSNKFTVPAGSILVSKLNPRVPRVWEPDVNDEDLAVASTEFLVLQPKEIDRRFLKYLCLSPAVRSRMEAMVTGTSGSHQRVRPADALNIEVQLPPLPQQRAIAHVLGTLDDKIELNRRMNETLEEMARALFKSWFVDFAPVRAKMEGRWRPGASLPGLPAHLHHLFPDRLADSALGEIPEGWGVRALDSIATFLNGLALQKYPATDASTLPVLKITQLRAGHTLGADLASRDLPPLYVVHDGDVLFSWSGSLELDIWAGGEGALNQHLFKITSTEYPKWLYYRWVREHLPGFREIAAGKATTMGHIQRHHLAEAYTIIPGPAMLKAMDRYMQSLHDRSLALRIHSRALAAQRDALLPALVSGEVGANSIDKAVWDTHK